MGPTTGKPNELRMESSMVLETADRMMTAAQASESLVIDSSGKPIGKVTLSAIIAAMVTPADHKTAQAA